METTVSKLGTYWVDFIYFAQVVRGKLHLEDLSAMVILPDFPALKEGSQVKVQIERIKTGGEFPQVFVRRK